MHPDTIIAGSSITMTCCVEISSAIDIPVVLNIVWNGPQGTILPDNQSEIVTYDSQTKVFEAIFRKVRSGDYICDADTQNMQTSSQFVTNSIKKSMVKTIHVGKLVTIFLFFFCFVFCISFPLLM